MVQFDHLDAILFSYVLVQYSNGQSRTKHMTNHLKSELKKFGIQMFHIPTVLSYISKVNTFLTDVTADLKISNPFL